VIIPTGLALVTNHGAFEAALDKETLASLRAQKERFVDHGQHGRRVVYAVRSGSVVVGVLTLYRPEADPTLGVIGLATVPAARRQGHAYNGPEMTGHALRDWCRFSKTGTAFIEPGSPWQNPFVQSFHARVRDELLDVEEFSCLAEARVVISDWQQDYNWRRPHSALGMLAPTVFAAQLAAAAGV